jgi:hypothetical protein
MSTYSDAFGTGRRASLRHFRELQEGSGELIAILAGSGAGLGGLGGSEVEGHRQGTTLDVVFDRAVSLE